MIRAKYDSLQLTGRLAQDDCHNSMDVSRKQAAISVSIPGRVFLFPGIREWQSSFPGTRE